MKKWSILLAYDVPHYATVIVDAETAEEAERLALTEKYIDEAYASFEPSWDASSDTRVCTEDTFEVSP